MTESKTNDERRVDFDRQALADIRERIAADLDPLGDHRVPFSPQGAALVVMKWIADHPEDAAEVARIIAAMRERDDVHRTEVEP